MIFNVSDLNAQEKYRLLTGGVTPRPIAWISTRSANNVDNLAPYSFFTVASCNPPVLLYTQVTPQSGADKDTLNNLIETGECVVNMVNTALLEKMNMTSASLCASESEFTFAQVKSCASEAVEPLSVEASPVRYECTLREVVPVGDLTTGAKLILLNVKSIYVRDDIYSNDAIDQALTCTVGKMGGDIFCDTMHTTEVKRP